MQKKIRNNIINKAERLLALFLAVVLAVESLPQDFVTAEAKPASEWEVIETQTGEAIDGAYGDGTYLLLNSLGEIYASEDGTDWNMTTQLDAFQEDMHLKFVNAYFFLYGPKGLLKVSQDGKTWVDISFDSKTVADVTYGEHYYYFMTGSFYNEDGRSHVTERPELWSIDEKLNTKKIS